MHILIRNGRVIDPASGLDQVGDVAIADGKILAVGTAPTDFTPTQTIDASGCWVLPGLVDLAVRLREPGHEHAGMLHSEMQAAVAGGVTSLVCPPDTDPVLDEQGLVEMLKFRAEKQHKARLFPMGALTQGLQGDTLTEMAELTESGCVAFGQADVPMANTQALARALAYATTFGFSVWLRPLDKDLGKGVAASGPSATRMGLADRVVMFNSLSKRSNLAGLRSGFAAGGPGQIAQMRRLRSYAGAPLPLPIQRVSAAAWADEAHVEASRALYQQKYAIADRVLGNIPGYQPVQGGFFLWLPVPPEIGDSEDAAKKLWAEAGIQVLPGTYLSRDTAGGNPGRNFLRVALVATANETEAALNRLKNCLYQGG